MKHLYFTILFLLFSLMLWSQQYPLFSNFVVHKYAYNPAVPVDPASISGNLLYRKQWVGFDKSPVTQVAGARLGLPKIPISIGAWFFSDVAGVLERKGGFASVAYTHPIAEDIKLTGGASLGTYRLKIANDFAASDPMDQLVTGGLDGARIPDINVGVHLQMKDLFVGVSAPQSLESDLEFAQIPEQSRWLRHYYGMVGYLYRINDKIAVEPSALVKFVPDVPTQIDVAARLLLNKFWVGASYRTDDAVAALAGVNFGNIEVAYSYDFTMSNIRNYSSGSHEISLGFRFGFKKDRDKDGIVDEEDECPDEPGTEENKGCPEEELAETTTDELADTDKDGVPDKDDKCPTIPGTAQFQGCPWGDRDSDGIRDDVDKCPDIAGTASNAGCPIDDRDRDGIVDEHDQCPDIPGPIISQGCPNKDMDGDGIVDALDPCPAEAGPKFNVGCPVEEHTRNQPTTKGKDYANLLAGNLAIRNVYFDTNEDFIRREHQTELDELAEFLVSNPEVRVEMTGHTDERADDTYNYELSKRRVTTVMFYLINRGVIREQTITEYYGETRPADRRNNDEGYQLNRRVELRLVFN